ncbi:Dam family site-specific DNA-(adenine-N6)-methyltransferase [Xanthomonas campestris pv. raphani]|uniref:DNA adenine methylase n=1 Tax=Xanthomonas campestris TaxID=339 RepID=UPI002B23BB66|nr:Dam family site-specific DNA-(adenine-N6)-methyltransferase [Xanthomonas campestris]MEA9884000.1 Dam family site-specific DNA-(adenine-N6)-methyltransferase [Xanthomonas campestris pv. raphani]
MKIETIPLPFLKWAGGKRWLTRDTTITSRIPKGLRYVEPFLGSAAMFFHALPDKALLNDFNADLIDTYRAIKEDWRGVVALLKRHQTLHLKDISYYYSVRDSAPESGNAKAARFIYLNRTCFNGLYRVNRRGQFNVPRGSKDTVVMSTDNFELISFILKNAQLSHGDFGNVIRKCGAGDFIFADPPYTVKHNHNGFIKYNEQLFSWADQVRLRDELASAAIRGASVVATNADHPSIHELYADFEVTIAERSSVMSSIASRRKKTTEVVITLNLD